jgi:hypothetical protein
MARKAFNSTPEIREKVRRLSGLGLPQDDIAKLTGCSLKTLRKHLRTELDIGNAEANVAVTGYLFNAAKSGNVTAQIFWIKREHGGARIPCRSKKRRNKRHRARTGTKADA